METHAAKNLRFIRDTMERASAFTAVPGKGGVVIGLTALAAGWIANARPLQDQFDIWLAEGFVAACLGTGALVWKSKRTGVSLSSRTAKRALMSFTAPIAAGAVLTLALCRSGQLEFFPGVWLLLYGLAVIAGGTFSVRAIPVLGLCFAVLGGFALLVPQVLANLSLTAGFGLLHIAFGAFIARRHGG